MSGEIGTNSFRADKKSRAINLSRDNRIPVRTRCANCGNRAYIIIPTYQLFAYPPGDPRIRQTGKDREEQWENWCFNCVRSGYIEDDMGRTSISVNT
jgi:hypothetical protein